MKEFEIYLPTAQNDGSATNPGEIERTKKTLAQAFGGFTHLRQRSEGAWSMGGVTFRDEVTILRVLDDGTANFDMHQFKKTLEAALKQENVLIVEREVTVIS
jgi:hypothetical protein